MTLDRADTNLDVEFEAVDRARQERLKPKPKVERKYPAAPLSANERAKEEKEWRRSPRYVKRRNDGIRRKVPTEEEAEESLRSYQKLKSDLFTLTAIVATALSAAAYATKGTDTALSVVIGGLGSLLYARLLSKKAEGDPNAPTLLIPAALFALAVNWKKYNGTERFGFEVELLPMIVGFLSYRAANLSIGLRDIIAEIQGDEDEDEDDDEDDDDDEPDYWEDYEPEPTPPPEKEKVVVVIGR
jgi:hypothetical protein